ncbi:MAG: hypothetical protein U5L46_11970 [Agrobacterium sp.]|nr:hypothetical protein [Agrobacterium sp.]
MPDGRKRHTNRNALRPGHFGKAAARPREASHFRQAREIEETALGDFAIRVLRGIGLG